MDRTLISFTFHGSRRRHDALANKITSAPLTKAPATVGGRYNCLAICLGQQGGETKKTLRAKGLEGSQKFFWETLKLFSSFLRGASCPKSPRFECERLSSFQMRPLSVGLGATALSLLCLRMKELSSINPV
jgi:hypothetical protein